jgi:1-phosphatidylinositol phosphodiesterase
MRQWLDDHPSEAVFLSFQYEGSTTPHGTDNTQVDLMLFNILNSTASHSYILQEHDQFSTLGQARGKVTLLKRFDLSNLPASYAAALPGVHFSPANWTDNDPNITLVYNSAASNGSGTAYIEDFYNIDTPFGSPASLAIQWKYNATTAHLKMAASSLYPNSLFWTFASSEYDTNIPAETPEIMALGNGTAYTPEGGVNQRLLPFIQGFERGTRLGIVMFDFFEQPAGLVDALLSLQQPNRTA